MGLIDSRLNEISEGWVLTLTSKDWRFLVEWASRMREDEDDLYFDHPEIAHQMDLLVESLGEWRVDLMEIHVPPEDYWEYGVDSIWMILDELPDSLDDLPEDVQIEIMYDLMEV